MKPSDVDHIQELLASIEEDKNQIEHVSNQMSEKISKIESLTEDIYDFDYNIRRAKRTTEDFVRQAQNIRFVSQISRQLRSLKRRLIRQEEQKRRKRRAYDDTESALKDLRRYLDRE